MSNDFYRLYDLSDNPEGYKIKFLFEGVLPLNGFSVMVGKSSAGKSLAAMRMAASLATGQPIAHLKNASTDWPINMGQSSYRGATLYFSGEGQAGMLSRMVAACNALPAAAIASLPDAFKGQLPIICMGKVKQPLIGSEQIIHIKAAIKERREFFASRGYPLRLIIFDTLVASFNIRDENGNSEMQDIVNALCNYAQAFDCHVMVISHPSKSHQRSKGDTRGASTLPNSADSVLELQKITNSDNRTLTVSKIRDGAGQGAIFGLRLETFNNVPALVPNHHLPKTKQECITITAKPENRILPIIGMVAQDGQATRKDILEKLIQLDTSEQVANGELPKSYEALEREFSRAILELKESGKIILHKKGKYHAYSLVADNNVTSANTESPTVEATPLQASEEELFRQRANMVLFAIKEKLDKIFPPPLHNA